MRGGTILILAVLLILSAYFLLSMFGQVTPPTTEATTSLPTTLTIPQQKINVSQCAGLSAGALDACYYREAVGSRNISLCGLIREETTVKSPNGTINLRDDCHEKLNIQASVLNKTAITEIFASNNLQECLKLSDLKYKTLRDNCILKTALFSKNESACELITDSQIKTKCHNAWKK